MESDSKANILLVDDHPENLLVLEALLEKLGQNLVKANSGEEALRCLLNQDFAVILLDVQMPEMDGFETAALIRQRERSRNTPIIFLTAFSTNDAFVFKGYGVGAVDYLLKPIDPVILTSKVSVFVDLYQRTAEVKRQAAQLAAINSELRQSEERFRSLGACSPVGIFLLNMAGQCTYTNPRCQVICGFTLTESLGEGWIQFLHPDDRDRAVSDWKGVIFDQQEFSTEYRFQNADGDVRWTYVRSAPMFSNDHELIGHVGTIEDITARKEAEAMRERLIREQAARQQAETINQMKDEFLAIVSHELRTPLNAILGWSKVLLTNRVDETTKARALETIERNARSQAKLIEDILDVSRIIRGKLRLSLQAIDLTELIEGVLETTRPLASSKEIQLQVNLSPNVPTVCGDPERLQQVIWNLLSNAIKFTPSGGNVEICLRQVTSASSDGSWGTEEHTREGISERDDHAAPMLMLQTLPTDKLPIAIMAHPSEYAQIQVRDTGVGIPADFLPHVFEHFRQADSTTTRSHGGLGLGLAIVRHLVELHHGMIVAESEGEGKGATFTVNLPLTKSAIEASMPSRV